MADVKQNEFVSLSIVVPAYNEEHNLGPTIDSIIEVSGKFCHRIEIIIINDGSADGTGKVAENLSVKYGNIKVLHHEFPKGLGTIFNTALILSESDFFCLVPGDNQIGKDYLEALFKNAGRADVVLSYPINPEIRNAKRRLISQVFVSAHNFLFGLKLKYYNGPAVFNLKKLKNIDMSTRFFSYHAEYVTRFIRYGYTYAEVGGVLKERKYGHSTALSWLSLLGVGFATLLLFVDIYYFRRKVYCKNGIMRSTIQ